MFTQRVNVHLKQNDATRQREQRDQEQPGPRPVPPDAQKLHQLRVPFGLQAFIGIGQHGQRLERQRLFEGLGLTAKWTRHTVAGEGMRVQHFAAVVALVGVHGLRSSM